MNLTTRVLLRRGDVCRVVTPFIVVLSALSVGSSPVRAAKTRAPATQSRVPEGVSASDWQSIRAAHEAWKHAVEPVKGGWQARNTAQQWTTQFDGRGFEAKPQSTDWTWGLELRSYGVGDEQREVKGTPEVKIEAHRLAYHWDATVQEWYVNDGRGLEHGFSVQQRPPGPSDAPLTFILATRGPLRAAVTDDARGVDYRDKSGVTVLTYSGLRVWDADGRELEARFAPAKNGVTLQVDAKDARYPLLIDPIAQQAYLKASNAETDDRFGSSIAISGNTVVVGAPSEDSSSSGVNSTHNNNAPDSGAAYVFVRNGTTWTQQAYLKASNPGGVIPPAFQPGVFTPGDGFGASVAIDGNTIAVGAPGEGTSTGGINPTPNNNAPTSGAAYVFVRSGTTWTQQAFLKASHPGGGNAGFTFFFNRGDAFGTSVAVSRNTLVVGAPGEDSNGVPSDNSLTDSGAAYLFVRSGTTWTQQIYQKASNPGGGTPPVGALPGLPGDSFGTSVAVSEPELIFAVGAPGEDSDSKGINGAQNNNNASDSGAVYVYARLLSGAYLAPYSQQAFIKASNAGVSDRFGSAVAISGETVVAGAPFESGTNNSVSTSGAAYVFVRNGTAWSQQAYVKASNAGTEDQLGAAVAISGDIMVAGAANEDSGSKGLNGIQDNNLVSNSGAAYVFVRNGSVWNQQAYVKASNAGTNNYFGQAVAIDGPTMVAGAPFESGNVTTVRSGAAYVFTGFGPTSIPLVTSSLFTSGFVGVPFSYQISAINSPTSYNATGLPQGLSVNPSTGAITGTPTSAGVSTVAISANNAGGTDTATLILEITVLPVAPVINSAKTASGPVGIPFSYQITSSGGMPTAYAATGLPVGLTINASTGVITGTPTVVGTFPVNISATNAGGTGTETLTITVSLPPPPVINSAKTASGPVGIPFSYQITSSGGMPTAYAATGLPVGLTINASTGAITGTPTVAGTFPVDISATNAGGTGTEKLTINILPAAPVIISAKTGSGKVGTPFSYTIAANNSPTGFNATGLPAGLSVNKATGVITGTPTAAGKSSVNLLASNAGGAGTATLTLTVAAAPTPPPPPTGPDRVAPTLKFNARPQFIKASTFALSALVSDDRAPQKILFQVKSPDGKWSQPKDVPLPSGAASTKQWKHTLKLNKEGRWEVRIQASDTAGNKSKFGTIVVIADRTKPTAKIISPASTNSRNYPLRVDLADRWALASVRYRLKELKATKFGAWTTAKLSGNKFKQVWSRPLALSKTGVWQIELQSIDAAGNPSTRAAIKVNRTK